MNEEKLDKEIRQFLKKVGIQSNQAIETAIREAVAEGKLQGDERLGTVVHLKLDALDLDLRIEGEIALK